MSLIDYVVNRYTIEQAFDAFECLLHNSSILYVGTRYHDNMNRYCYAHQHLFIYCCTKYHELIVSLDPNYSLQPVIGEMVSFNTTPDVELYLVLRFPIDELYR